MLRLLVLLFALLGIAGAAPANQARDWRQSVVKNDAGSYVIGNPKAKVQLIEYISYGCPHCAQFVADSKADLHDRLVRSGAVRIEVRHIAFDRMDMAAALVARCAGPARFVAATQAIYANQGEWHARGHHYEASYARSLGTQSELMKLKYLAEGAGLAELVQGLGVPAAALDACFQTNADALLVAGQSGAGLARIDGTPAFEVNGKLVKAATWAQLQPHLRAAGAP